MPLQMLVHLYLQPQPNRGKYTGLYISIQKRASLGVQAGADRGQPGPGAAGITKSNQAHKPSWHMSALLSFREIKSNSFPSSLPSAVVNTLPFYSYNLTQSQFLTSLNFQQLKQTMMGSYTTEHTGRSDALMGGFSKTRK